MKLYGEYAGWFHLLTAPEDYAEEAAVYRQAILDTASRPVVEVLELGSGGGNNASHLKAHFDLTLVDVSPEMLELSRGLNPGLPHVVGDMRTVRLGRRYDAVFVHDAVEYMTSEADLRAAIRTAAEHLRPGGVALFAPDHTRETLVPGTDHGGHDAPDGRGLRYVEWTWDSDPDDTMYNVDFGLLLRERDGTVRADLDRHICGVFPRADWLRWLAEASLEPSHRRAALDDGTPIELFLGSTRPIGA